MKRSGISRQPKKKSVGWYKKLLDHKFSQYIRQKYAVNGMTECVTCGAKHPWKQMQNGHYIARNHMNTRYSEKNNHPQCIGCNMFKNGNMDEYALFLIKTYGEGILEELQREKQKIRQIRIPEYQELIELYENKIKELSA